MSKNSFYLGFKVNKDEFKVFTLVGNQVQPIVADISTEDGSSVCSCNSFRFRGYCNHARLVAGPKQSWLRGEGRIEKLVDPLNWNDAGPFSAVAYRPGGEEQENSIIKATLGDLSLFDLVWLIENKKMTDKIAGAEGVLNPDRIYAECMASASFQEPVDSSKVMRAGKTVPKIAYDRFGMDYDYVDHSYDPSVTPEPTPEPALEEETEMPASVAVKTELPEEPASELNWKDVKMPDPRQFYVDPTVWQNLVFTILNGGNILLTGPSGAGKSELTGLAAQACGMGYLPMNCGAASEPRQTFIGNM